MMDERSEEIRRLREELALVTELRDARVKEYVWLHEQWTALRDEREKDREAMREALTSLRAVPTSDAADRILSERLEAGDE